MPIPKKIIKYLEQAKVKYEIIQHRTVYTAYDAAATLHVKISQLAKNLLVKAGSQYALAVLPADRNLDLVKLAKLIGVARVTLPKEGVMQTQFKVKPGGLPAFGRVFGLPVYWDKSLNKEKQVIFSSGSFTESIKLTVANYKKLEQPVEGNFSLIKKIKKPKAAQSKSKQK